MKTTHSLARELLALPDKPVYHHDPSFAGLDEETDSSLSEPHVELNQPARWQEQWRPFVTISGAQDLAQETNDLDALREDARRLEWVIKCIQRHGTNGLCNLVRWSPDAPFDRDRIDAAMRDNPL